MLDLLCALLLLASILLVVFMPRLAEFFVDSVLLRRAQRFVDRDEPPVTADLYHPCLGCGRRPQPDFVPFCSCGRGLARIVDSVPTPDDEPTWPTGGGEAA